MESKDKTEGVRIYICMRSTCFLYVCAGMNKWGAVGILKPSEKLLLYL